MPLRQIAFILTLSITLLSAIGYALDVTVAVDASSYIRAIPETMYGMNLMAWDGAQGGGSAAFNNLMMASGRNYNRRWPGGSWGDAFLWSDMQGPGDANAWIVSYEETQYLLGKIGGRLQPIVNFPAYWYGIDHEDACAVEAAVAWVQDQKTRIPTARYWEIGNEVYGTWEAGWFSGISGTYYGNRFADFYIPMKTANPAIKIGAVAVEGDTNGMYDWYVGYWNRDLLSTAAARGVIPDFLIVHGYFGYGQGASYNPTLLSTDVGAVASYTNTLNTQIAATVGSQYIGKIKYWMTEYDVWSIDSYQRHKCYINAMFHSQLFLEMAKFGWEGSNPWNQSEVDNYNPDYAYPVWYAMPVLIYNFGRDMVSASSSLSTVRAYASRDDANNLTIFMVNNSATTDRTVTVNISGFAAASTGEQWLIEPAGTLVSGGLNLQDYNDLSINGVRHPNPLTISSLDGQSITTSNSFNVNLERSRMVLIKIPPASIVQQSPYGDAVWSIPGTIEAEDYDTGGKFTAYYDTTAGNSGGQYRTDDVDIETCSEGGFNITGIKAGEWLEYIVDVESSGIYKIQARVASADVNGEFRIELGGQDVTGPVGFAATGGAQTWTNVDANNVFLTKGEHTMRLLMDANDWKINRISFNKLGGGTNKVLREWWTGISGGTVANLTSNVNYPYNPTGRSLEHSFEGPTSWADNYGTRLRGYLHPAVSGSYTFWIASDDASDLYLSTDDNPANKTRIAYVSSWTNPYKWTTYGTQQSSPISLTAGQKYYIEALQKEGSGGDNIAVAWQGPGIIRQVITGAYLSPYVIAFKEFDVFADQWFNTGCNSGNAWCNGADLTRNGSVMLDDLMKFVEDQWLLGGE